MIDQQIFFKIYDLAGHWMSLDVLMIWLAGAMMYLLPISLVLFLVLNKNKKQELIMLAMAGLAVLLSRGIIVSLIRLAWHRPRPFVALHLIPLIPYIDRGSFPSGHAAALFALALIVYCFHKKTGIVFLVLSGLGALARVYVGIHWPSDILVGALLGLGSAILIHWLFKKRFKIDVILA